MSKKELQGLMNENEIHDFGIQVVVEWMASNGFEVLGVRTEPDYNPQILARKDGRLAHVVVRTKCFPEKGSLDNQELCNALIQNADQDRATCYFASVGIANAEATSDEELSIPRRGAGFVVAFDGLVILTSSDRAHLL